MEPEREVFLRVLTNEKNANERRSCRLKAIPHGEVDAQLEIALINPDIYAVNEDGDKTGEMGVLSEAPA